MSEIMNEIVFFLCNTFKSKAREVVLLNGTLWQLGSKDKMCVTRCFQERVIFTFKLRE